MRAVGKLAAASLLARYWPDQGARQDAALALAGGLARSGWSSLDIEVFIRTVAEGAGDDESSKRVEVVDPTVEKVEAGKEATGWPSLSKLLGEKGKKVVAWCRKWLGCEEAATKDEDGPRQNIATRLVRLAERSDAELFHDPNGTGYIALEIDGHLETWPLKSKTFRDWLAARVYEADGTIPNTQAVDDAVGMLAGKARFRGQEREAPVRVAQHGDKIYLDLGYARWRAVEIDAGGWRIVDRPPIYFRRPNGMLALPEPERGGSVSELRELLNVGDERNWRMIVAWLLCVLRPSGPYPLLVLCGEQGSAKSTT